MADHYERLLLEEVPALGQHREIHQERQTVVGAGLVAEAFLEVPEVEY